MLVEAFVAELPVEAFDVAVLRWAVWLDQDVLDAMLLRPGDEGAAGELGPIINQCVRRVDNHGSRRCDREALRRTRR